MNAKQYSEALVRKDARIAELGEQINADGEGLEEQKARIAELEAELSIEQKENRRLRARLHGARIAERAAEKECATLPEVCGNCGT